MQRFGDALNRNPHLHCLVLDGVYAAARFISLSSDVGRKYIRGAAAIVLAVCREVPAALVNRAKTRGWKAMNVSFSPHPSIDDETHLAFNSPITHCQPSAIEALQQNLDCGTAGFG
jgi:hypothetical protein